MDLNPYAQNGGIIPIKVNPIRSINGNGRVRAQNIKATLFVLFIQYIDNNPLIFGPYNPAGVKTNKDTA